MSTKQKLRRRVSALSTISRLKIRNQLSINDVIQNDASFTLPQSNPQTENTNENNTEDNVVTSTEPLESENTPSESSEATSPTSSSPSVSSSPNNTLNLKSTGSKSLSVTLNFSSSPYKNSNFWDIKGYKPAIERCDNGYKIGTNMMDCLHERAKINQEHAKSIAQWSKKWSDFVKTESTEYGGAKEAWLELLEIEDEIAKINTELCIRYQENVNSMENWLKVHYQRHIINFNQQKYFREEFEDAQKEWRKVLEKLNGYKKEYDSLVKKNGNDESAVEFKEKKLKISKHCHDQIDLLKHFEPKYKSAMKEVFEETQKLERLRKKELKKIFNNWLSCIKDQIDDGYNFGISKVENFNSENDLKWFSDNCGAGVEFKLPDLCI